MWSCVVVATRRTALEGQCVGLACGVEPQGNCGGETEEGRSPAPQRTLRLSCSLSQIYADLVAAQGTSHDGREWRCGQYWQGRELTNGLTFSLQTEHCPASLSQAHQLISGGKDRKPFHGWYFSHMSRNQSLSGRKPVSPFSLTFFYDLLSD